MRGFVGYSAPRWNRRELCQTVVTLTIVTSVQDLGVNRIQAANCAKNGQAGLSPSSLLHGRFWRAALLTTAGLLGSISSASALPQDFWSQDFSPSDQFFEDTPTPRIVLPRRTRTQAHRAARLPKPVREVRKPQGPLIVAISIENQSLKVYDANGFFAESPVSTGMRGHTTPMGVFSVIQKHKWHRSNIYSSAPMPYMQRLTWSGIALHAGVVPGYPASHGCIRMPTGFATQMWGWTRMGARVVITPGEIAPTPFSHPLLMTQKPTPAPVASGEPAKPQAAPVEASTPSASTTGISAAAAPAESELRPSITTDAAPRAHETTGLAKADNKADKPTLVADASSTLPRAASTTLTDGPVTDKAIAVPTGEASTPATTPPRRTGPIAIFVSRKDGKLYVRQNFEPLFDVAITIAPSDRPLGTHVFTAQEDKSNGSYRWSAMTLPAAARASTEETHSRKQRVAGAVATTSTPASATASEALDRVTIPAEAMTRIAEALTTGSSLIVSDQGVASGETGQGTDFIVPLR